MTESRPETQAVHGGRLRAPGDDPWPGEPAVLPVHRETITAFESGEQFTDVMADARLGYLYSRIRHPNADELAAAVAALEGTPAAHCFASGMAAVSAGLDLLAPAGARVVASRRLYGQTYAILRRRGNTAFVDLADLDAVGAALEGAALLYLETISNPQVDVADLEALVPLAHARGAAVMVDNTVATPLGCRPTAFGADLVVHSATKYLNGHSDALAGVAAGGSEVIERIAAASLDTGATISPDTAWLVRRGIRTLHVRFERAGQNAGAIAAMLADHPAVAAVHYPGLATDPGHAVAQRVLQSPGALLAFEVSGGSRAAIAAMNRLQVILRATSLGGVESAISHPATTSHRQLDEDELRSAGIGPGTLRLAVGIEHADDLIADLDVALRA